MRITPDQVVEVPKDQQVSNAVITYESDLFGALKATGALAPNGAPPQPAATRSVATAADHPINPKVIGTAQDTQLNTALDLLGRRRAAAR